MKLITYRYENKEYVGVLTADESAVHPLPYGDMTALIEDQLSAAAAAESLPISSVEVLAPIPRPRQDVICLGINYKAHADEAEQYSDAFKKEWEDYYGFPWRPQHESPENTWLSNKLKYELYYRALEEVFTYAKEYGRSKGMDIRCYVPTHSLVNYSQWQIVSPEASLASLPVVDGYIARTQLL